MRPSLLVAALLAAACSHAQTLVPNMPEPGGSVYAIEKIGGTVYIGGGFTTVDGTPRARLARFNAATGALDSWAPNVGNNYVNTLTRAGDKLIAGGNFTSVDGQQRLGIALFDLATGALEPWSDMANFVSWRQGVGVQGSTFYYCPFSPCRIVAVDATTSLPTGWQSTPLFEEQGNINAILVADGYVYAGGIFRFASGPGVYDDLCRFHLSTGELDSTWHPQPSVNNFGVTAIVRTNDHVVVGGDYDVIAGQNRQGVAAFTPAGALTPFAPNNSSYEVLSLHPGGDRIWVGGNSYLMGGQTRYRIAQLDLATGAATCWNAAPISNAWSTVQAIEVVSDTVYAGPFGSPALAVLVGGPMPPPPASISGPPAVVPGATATYTVPFIAGHTWTWTITGGTGSSTTNSIDVTWGAGPVGTVTVVANNTGQANCSSDPTAMQVFISGTNGLGPAAADDAGIVVFPNPTTGRLTVRWAQPAPPGAMVRVVDAMGREWRSAAVRGTAIDLDLGELPRGCYGVRVDTAEGLWTGRVVKE
ncbi:MAG: hypothetical protein JNJ64_12120 [Flavobacteriales bacterium]|nr:hypothetical protein [Flavobacteriales bacterium]